METVQETVNSAALTLKGTDQFRQSSQSRYTLGDKITEQLHNLNMTSSGTEKETSAADHYDIVTIKESDIENVILFLRRFFFKDEPLNVDQNLLETEDATCPELEQYCIESIKEKMSLMAQTPSGRLLGVCINGISRPNASKDESDECTNPKFRKILKLLYTVDKQADVFGKFPDISCTLDVKIISVDDACRGRGIAKFLLDRTEKLAVENGCPIVRVDCTSHFSARAVSKLNYECVYTLKYADYQENEKPIFKPEPPHNEVKIYLKRV